MSALFCGDTAATDLGRRRRAAVTIADLADDQAAHERATILHAWLAAQGNPAAEIRAMAAATQYDAQHPDDDSLAEELAATTAGDDATEAAA
ncbi:hypothetical protein [Streptomyces aidingensis]|uniref:Uncharacterized protein n=1 Tax=Streptomyces aidingensis TaxID=910347 RepID=A0A1I1PVG0_9ACTN|nr:hypothetical protein [Streptomyces aidingensis]SFD13839.1 hypothetical protein SAMN05421773_11079 [Streptomyces aidingensis]